MKRPRANVALTASVGLLLALCLSVSGDGRAAAAEEPPRATIIVVVGAAGSPEYEEAFRKWAAQWQAAAERGAAACQVIGLTAADDADKKVDREQLRAAINGESSGAGPLWLVLIGHGTFDGKVARFNLRGPDLSSGDLKEWLQATTRPLAIIDCSACSGPFLADLSGKDRAVVTATRAGSEVNFAHFGEFLAAAIGDPAVDLDKDQQTSLLEAFVAAGARLREFYAKEARLATEHPLLDDNGDRLGTPVEWFQGLRPTKAAKSGATLDGALAASLVLAPGAREQRLTVAQRLRRDELERAIAAIRSRKTQLSEDEYLQQLEPLLVELARLYAP
ncbi:MAG: hypothetical protein U0939_19065 [Pirellulales bacterium]